MSGVPLWMWLIGALFMAALLIGVWQIQGRKTAFRKIAPQLGGSCIENALTFQVVVPTPNGTITLDTFTSTSRGDTPDSTIYTRLHLPLVGLTPFEFALMSRTTSTQLLMQTVDSPVGQLATAADAKARESLRVLRAEELRLGDSAFDQAFILKSTQEMQARQLFEKVKDQLPTRNEFQLFLQPHGGAAPSPRTHTMILHYQEKGVVTDVAHLRTVCRLLQYIAQELQSSGVASNQKPNVPSPLAL